MTRIVKIGTFLLTSTFIGLVLCRRAQAAEDFTVKLNTTDGSTSMGVQNANGVDVVSMSSLGTVIISSNAIVPGTTIYPGGLIVTSSITLASSSIGTTDGGNTYANYESTGYIVGIATNVTNGAALGAVPGFQFQLAPSTTWFFDCNLYVTNAAAGVKYGINGPTGSAVTATIFATSAAGTFSSAEITAINTATGAFGAAAGSWFVWIKGTMTTNSANAGTWTLQRESATAGQSNTLNVGSGCWARRIQ